MRATQANATTEPFPVWITGAGGLIGNALVESAAELVPSWQIYGLTRSSLELLDTDAVRTMWTRTQPKLVIHCAAMSHTPACDKNPELAKRVNVNVTALLCSLASGVRFFFFSTDQVFDGHTGNYNETAQRNPFNVYGETKAAAEDLVLSNPNHTVIRTSLNGGVSPTGDRGFNERLRIAFRNGETVRLFIDEYRTPIPAMETARAVWELAIRNAAGAYHVAGAERLSRWEIGQLIAQRWTSGPHGSASLPQLQPRLEPCSLANFPGPRRGPDTSLNCSKAQQLLSFPLPRLSHWLAARPELMF
ncbi:MAG TPA: SDR family oxidoreductase [Verrucomicrobiae bacterium]|nr:SDR family oxidoreductase [Verrucomicrobiae bacterium]